MLDLGVGDGHALVDGGVGADVGISELAVLADDRRPAHDAVLKARTLSDDDPALDLAIAHQLTLHDRFLEVVEHDAVGFQHVGELPGVLPPARDEVGVDPVALVNQPLDGVRDLELPAGRGVDGVDRLEDGLGEEVDPHECQVGLGGFGLLLEVDDPAFAVEHGHAELVGVGDLGKQDRGVGLLSFEVPGKRRDAAPDQVVAQVHDEGRAGHELLGDLDGMRETQRSLLGQVGDRDAPGRAVAHCRPHLGAGIPDDDADLADPCIPHRLDGIEQDRLVGDGNQLFGSGVGDGPQARPLPPTQDQPFHTVACPFCRGQPWPDRLKCTN
ncbi:hypothetical protein D3C86_543110 [compost metagenome]